VYVDAHEREDTMQINCANCGTAVDVDGGPGDNAECKCGNTLTVPEKPPKEQFGVVHCSNCWKRYGVVGRPAGTRFKCKSCGEIITIRQGGAPKGGAAKSGPERAAPSKRPGASSKARRPGGGKATGATRTTAATRETTATAEHEVSNEAAAVASKKLNEEVAKLKSTLQKYKAAVAENDATVNKLRSELDEKSRVLGEREAELSRQIEEARTLHERNTRQAAEIGALEQEIAARAEESATLKSQKEDLEKLLKLRDDDVAARDEKMKQLEAELADRPTREETKKFYEDKETTEKRLEDGGAKLSAIKEAIAQLRAPLAESLKKFDELGADAGDIDLPDFTTELNKAKQEAEERRLAFSTIKAELDSEKHTNELLKHQKDDLAAELERSRKEQATARKRFEDAIKAAEEDIEQMAASSSTAERRKGFLRGLFGGGSKPEPTRPRASSSRFRLRAAAALEGTADEDEVVAKAEDVAEAPPEVDEAVEVDDVVEDAPVEQAPEAIDEVEEPEEAAEAEGVEEAEEEEPPKEKKEKKRGRLRKRRR
jgi:ribosomal protein S27E/DNA repair exonuclease SbcCD ATPase subunit